MTESESTWEAEGPDDSQPRCAVHNDREAVGSCRLCGRPVCEACAVQGAAHICCTVCAAQLAAAVTGTPGSGETEGGDDGGEATSDRDADDDRDAPGEPRAATPWPVVHTTAPPGRRSSVLAFMFSLVPGAGHMYLGLVNRGLQIMALFFGTLFLSTHLFLFGDLWPMVIAPVTWFYSFFDSLQSAGRLAQGEPVEDRPLVNTSLLFQNLHLWGWALIILGGLALLETVPPIWGFMGFRGPNLRPILVPLAIIGAGFYLLTRERHHRRGA